MGKAIRKVPDPASVNPSRYLIAGMDATQVPNTRLDAENKNATANTGFSFINEEMFLIIMNTMIAKNFICTLYKSKCNLKSYNR